MKVYLLKVSCATFAFSADTYRYFRRVTDNLFILIIFTDIEINIEIIFLNCLHRGEIRLGHCQAIIGLCSTAKIILLVLRSGRYITTADYIIRS